MKKYLIAIILLLSLTGISYAQEETETYDEMSTSVADQDVIFKSVIPGVVPAEPGASSGDILYFDDSREYKEIDSENMPLFKQLRLKVSNLILETQYRNADGENTGNSKWKFWEKSKQPAEDVQSTSSESELSNVIQSETSAEDTEKVLSLTGGINENVAEKEMILDSENIAFDEETGDVIANDRPTLIIPPQQIKIIADTITYNEYSNIINGIGNVIIYKDGIPTMGDYLEIDMNEETILMDGVYSKTGHTDATAEKAIHKDGLLVLTKGSFVSDRSEIHRIESRVAGPSFSDMIVNPESKALLFGNPEGNKLRLDIDSIYIDAQKNHDKFKVKKVKIYHKDKYLFTFPSLTAYTDKDREYFEANYPEFGSNRKVGMFAGPGFVFGGPMGSIVKVVPFLNYKDKFGIGGMLKYVNSYNRTILGYGSSNDVFFLKGQQRLDDNLFLQYGANTYMDEWFLGGRMAKYMTELYYDKSYMNRNFLGKGMHLTFRHRAGFGLMKDDDSNYNGEKFSSSQMSTTRTRYMAQINQTLYSYKNDDQRFYVRTGVMLQGSAALYGTGDTQFVARVAPYVNMQYKNWMQSIGYYLTGYDDHTPMPIYDAYRYGRQSVYITEALRLNKYLSVGWAGYINLSDDSPNGKMFQENAFLVALGPDDCRVIFGYDFTRERTYFGINVAFDPKGTKINYDRMEIKNPERFGKNYNPEEEDSERKVAFAKPKERPELPSQKRNQGVKAKPVVLEYAQVINIEDPDRERID